MLTADINKDGMISQEELKAFLDENTAYFNDAIEDIEAAKQARGTRITSEAEQLDEPVRKAPAFSQQIFKILFDKL